MFMDHLFTVKRFDIDLGKYQVVLHDKDAEELGVHSQDRVKVGKNGDTVTAIVDTTDSAVEPGTAGVFVELQHRLDLQDGDQLKIVPAEKPASIHHIRKKMRGGELSTEEIDQLVHDIVDGDISDIELASYVTALEIRDMVMREVVDLTRCMVKYGEVIDFEGMTVFDKHSIGGVPGNKITLIVVPIVAAAGLLIPKTSSRAVTGAAGTSDIMECFCNVTLTGEEIKRIALEHGGVMAWGGGVNLAPADDIIIRVEHPLGLDPRAQLLASVMAKKKAVSAHHVVIDLPTGEGTKLPNPDAARRIAREFIELGDALGMRVECALTYGGQPVGKTIGPALEGNEALAALRGEDAPGSLLEKSCVIAGMLLEMGGVAPRGRGRRRAEEILASGEAHSKFWDIVKAQGGQEVKQLEVGRHRAQIQSIEGGYVTGIGNKTLVNLARLCGAPKDKGAGVVVHRKRGDKVDVEDPLLTLYAESDYKLKTALLHAKQFQPIRIEGMLLQRIPEIRELPELGPGIVRAGSL
jgi:AMP phosphorylase